MPTLKLTTALDTNHTVSAQAFGGNAVYTRNTDDGTPYDEFLDATAGLDMPTLRYPAGQPDVAYLGGMLQNGRLPDHFRNFMDAAKQNGQTVVVVTPTHAAYSGPQELQRFVELAAETYPETIHAFEIGNEYWNHQTEASYGTVANESVLAISRGLDDANTDFPIWVQMGDPTGKESSFHSSNSNLSWGNRTIQANETIIDRLSTAAKNEIDGVVEHFYLRQTDQFLPIDYVNPQNIEFDYSIWNSALRNDLTLNITEWNIRTTNTEQHGIKAASAMLAQFKYLIDMEIDEAYVWPPQHNTATDLAGLNEVQYDDDTGYVINSPSGAMFDMMSSNIVGMDLHATAASGDTRDIMHFAYADDSRVVVYVASRSEDLEHVSFDLGDFWANAELKSATRVGYDKSTSDNRHYDYQNREWATPETIQVRGQDYITNEHDVGARIDVLNVQDDDLYESFSFSLMPYEVIQLEYELDDFREHFGQNNTDRLQGTSAGELYYVRGGNDVVRSAGGNDRVFGGNGNDFLDLGSGNDTGIGGAGSDTIKGWGGADHLDGSAGNDRLEGWFGRDTLIGGAGDDQLIGLGDGDKLTDGDGKNILDGGDGDDNLYIAGNTKHKTGWAQNVSSSNQSGTDETISLNGYYKSQAVLIGGNGVDTVNLGSRPDAFFLHDAYSGFHDEVTLSRDSSGNMSAQRFQGIERINAFGGNDLIDLTSPDYSLRGQNLTINAGTGNDVVWGSDADETIYGSAGNDTIFGGTGDNVLFGGSGADVFEFAGASDSTTISDFSVAEGDTIKLYNTADFTFRLSNLDIRGSNVTFNDGSARKVEIEVNSDSNLENMNGTQLAGMFEIV